MGAGPGISLSVAKRFGREGYTVVLISRSPDKLQEYINTLSQAGVQATGVVGDAADEASLQAALAAVEQNVGKTDVLLYNAALLQAKPILRETAETLVEAFRVNVAGALTAVSAVMGGMTKGESSILLTGGNFANEPKPIFGALGIGKAGILNLAKSLSAALAPKGIYVGTITILGLVSPDSPVQNPDNIAEHFWKMHTERSAVELVL